MQTLQKLGEKIKTLSEQKDFKFNLIGQVLTELQPQDIGHLLNEMLTQLKNKGKLPTFSEDHIYLYREKEFNMFIRFAATGNLSPQLAANEFDAFILNLSPKIVKIPAYQSQLDINDLDKQPVALEPIAPVEIANYGLHYIAAFETILDIPAASNTVPLLIVHSEKRAWSTWSFDRVTLHPLGRFCTDLRASRLQLALAFLQKLERSPEIVRELITLAPSDYAEFVRWEAIKYLYQLDPNKGLEVLQKVAFSDSNKNLRQAAQTTLGVI